ncbi:hypothetical protein KAH81_05485 [bacterium]|nr:hypothetical protein [bacterium]
MIKFKLVLLILIFVISIFSTNLFAVERNFSIFAEFKYGNSVAHDISPMGVGGSIDFPVIGENGRLGFGAGIMIISSWSDTLNLKNSPEPEDTLLYDVWYKNGTDINLFLGPSVRYRLELNEVFSISTFANGGILINISAYDEVKKDFDPPPIYSISETPTDIEFYIKPKIVLSFKRFFVGYEFFGVSENLDHVFCVGIMI